ncbi:hypothetical protein EC973_003868 [Apophysomyces ossiformis]|uniref:G-patch domain-containing protein n=1 Tax=Apophysomyces ossiformis TaxID=679940 RepID=A0A8H7BM08_9FUNG|nr:hypothetical protein EC973_003868 [Apophysomyces ossiformis]
MSDSDEDYMSSKFLEEAQVYEKSKQSMTYTERRRKQLQEQAIKGYNKPRKELEREAREEGLRRQMEESNKGMKMLQKMGFKKGMTLGKDSKSGLQEPIAVQMKNDRGGLGMQAVLKRAREEREKEELEARKKAEVDPDSFREVMAVRAKQAALSRRIVAAAHLCQKLDQAKNIEANILWALIPEPEEEEKEEKVGLDAEDQIQYEKKEVTEDEEEKSPPPEEVLELKALPLDDQLGRVVSYLRSQHNYCFWCGAQYDDENDLAENCPGPEEDDH